MHVPDSSGIVGGLYVASPTRTIIGRHALNAFAQEILGVLADAGITPRASGTADAAAGYTGQLLAAIKVCSNKQWANGVTLTFAETAAASSITPPTNSTVLHLGGSYAGNVTLAENDSNYTNRLIIIVNTGSGLLSIGSSSARVRLEPGRMILFKYDATRSTNSKWVPAMFPKDTDSVPEGSTNIYWTQARFDSAFNIAFGLVFDDAFETDFATLFPLYLAAVLASNTFSVEFRTGSGIVLGTGTANYRSNNGIIFLSIPALSVFTVNMSTHGTGGTDISMRITGASAAQIPSAARMTPVDTNGALINVLVDGISETWLLRQSGSNVGWLGFRRVDDGNLEELDTHTVKIPAQTISWANF